MERLRRGKRLELRRKGGWGQAWGGGSLGGKGLGCGGRIPLEGVLVAGREVAGQGG